MSMFQLQERDHSLQREWTRLSDVSDMSMQRPNALEDQLVFAKLWYWVLDTMNIMQIYRNTI